jgi:cytochrome c oxidase subunit II
METIPSLPDTFNLPPQASTLAPPVDDLFYFIYWLSVFFFIVITVGTVFFAIRYRKKADDKWQLTTGFSHSWLLEIIWSVIPGILFFIIFFWGWEVFLKFQVAPGNAKEIRVNAAQWSWEFKYDTPTGVGSSKDLIVPVGQPIKLLMTSRDVLHSLYIPHFRVKMDIVPNRYTTLWFEATNVGTYDLFCTEFCGTDHSRMGTHSARNPLVKEEDVKYRVIVVTQEEYDKIVPTLVRDRDGEEIYKSFCIACHSVDGTAKVGPSFKDLHGKMETMTDGSQVEVTRDYLIKSINEPMADVVQGYAPTMPPLAGSLTPGEIDNVVNYIVSLSSKAEEEPPTAPEGAQQ